MFDVKKIREDFPILSREVYGKPLVYLDSAATAQKPQRVIDKINFLHTKTNANIHRAVHCLSEESTAQYEEARETIRRFIGAGSVREIIFTSGATAAINSVAYSFGDKYVGEGDNIIVTEMEHHSNIVPWQMLCGRKGAKLRVLPFADDGRLMTEKLRGLIDERTRLVCVTQASNVLGTVPPLKEIIPTAHSAGVPVLVDGCQGIVHGGVDVRELDCDFYVFSGHKLYGPTGTGVLYGKEKYLEEMPPFLGGGDMVSTVTFEKTTYADLPLKFEAGTANYIGAIGMAEAVRYIEQFDPAEIKNHEDGLRKYASERLEKIDGLRIYGIRPDKCSIISFTVEGTYPADIGMILDKTGVAVRTGTHCAEPVAAHYGITSTVRVSLAIYNTVDEIDILERSLRRAVGMLRG